MKFLIAVQHHHAKTKSYEFLDELLPATAETRLVIMRPGKASELLAMIHDEVPDVVVLHQLEFLARIPNALGIPTVCTPMFDGCSRMPLSYWRQLRPAGVLAFSKSIQRVASLAGLNSRYLQYFPAPSPSAWGGQRRSLLSIWLRPGGIPIRSILALRLHKQVETVWIHDPDLVLRADPSAVNIVPRVEVTTDWLSQSELEERFDSTELFVAPRWSEGVGMSFLHAAARGAVAVGHVRPTMTEYLSPRRGGICVDFRRPRPLAGLIDIPLLRERSLQQSLAGRRHFEEVGPATLAGLINRLQPVKSTTSRSDLMWEMGRMDSLWRSLDAGRFAPPRGISAAILRNPRPKTGLST
jgi:hypothetical protein